MSTPTPIPDQYIKYLTKPGYQFYYNYALKLWRPSKTISENEYQDLYKKEHNCIEKLDAFLSRPIIFWILQIDMNTSFHCRLSCRTIKIQMDKGDYRFGYLENEKPNLIEQFKIKEKQTNQQIKSPHQYCNCSKPKVVQSIMFSGERFNFCQNCKKEKI